MGILSYPVDERVSHHEAGREVFGTFYALYSGALFCMSLISKD